MNRAMQIQMQVVMTLNPICGTEEMTVKQALKLMESKKIHHLPVVKILPTGDKQLLGIISHRDLLHATSIFIGTKAEDRKDMATLDIHLRGFMRKTVHTLPPEAPLKLGIRLVLDKKVGSIPIVNPGRVLVGIVTVHDMLKVLDDFVA